MLVHIVPAAEGMPQQELYGRLQGGWIKVGRQVVQVGSGVIDPTKPGGGTGLVDMDVWLLPEPTIPARVLAMALQHVLSQRPHAKTALNDVVQAIAGVDLEEFVAQMAPPRERDGKGNGV